MAKIKVKYEAFGMGGLLQLIGVICLFFFPIRNADRSPITDYRA